jgi:hypothetical protein
VALVVGADVLEVEALGQLEVELDGRHLPRAPMASRACTEIFGP